MKLDTQAVAAALALDPRVVLALLFGSSRDGTVRPGSDIDLGVLFVRALSPRAFYTFCLETTARLPDMPELDWVDLNHAGSILAFEALRGQRLLVRDAEIVAGFASRVAREYEDDMQYARPGVGSGP